MPAVTVGPSEGRPSLRPSRLRRVPVGVESPSTVTATVTRKAQQDQAEVTVVTVVTLFRVTLLSLPTFFKSMRGRRVSTIIVTTVTVAVPERSFLGGPSRRRRRRRRRAVRAAFGGCRIDIYDDDRQGRHRLRGFEESTRMNRTNADDRRDDECPHHDAELV